MAGAVSMRDRPRFLFGNPRDVTRDSFVRQQSVARRKVFGQHTFVGNQVMNAPVAETAHVQTPPPEFLLAIPLNEPAKAMNAARNEMMERQRDRTTAQFAR